MDLVKVDAIRAEFPQTLFAGLRHGRGAQVPAAHFGGDHDLVATAAEGLAEKLLR